MISYTGQGNYFELQLIMWGDGMSASRTVDLSKSPFNLNFSPNPPYMVVVRSVASIAGIGAGASLSANLLTVTFSSPPPFVDPTAPDSSLAQTLTLRFIYQ